jgi:hypothetical protein
VGSVPAPLLIWIKLTALRSQMTPVCLGVRPLSTARDFSQIAPDGAACRPTEAGRNLLQSLIGNGHDENALNPVPDHAATAVETSRPKGPNVIWWPRSTSVAPNHETIAGDRIAIFISETACHRLGRSRCSLGGAIPNLRNGPCVLMTPDEPDA